MPRALAFLGDDRTGDNTARVSFLPSTPPNLTRQQPRTARGRLRRGIGDSDEPPVPHQAGGSVTRFTGVAETRLAVLSDAPAPWLRPARCRWVGCGRGEFLHRTTWCSPVCHVLGSGLQNPGAHECTAGTWCDRGGRERGRAQRVNLRPASVDALSRPGVGPAPGSGRPVGGVVALYEAAAFPLTPGGVSAGKGRPAARSPTGVLPTTACPTRCGRRQRKRWRPSMRAWCGAVSTWQDLLERYGPHPGGNGRKDSRPRGWR